MPHDFKKNNSHLPAFCIHCGTSNADLVCKASGCDAFAHERCRAYLPPYCSTPQKLLGLLKLQRAKEVTAAAGEDISVLLGHEGARGPGTLPTSALTSTQAGSMSDQDSSMYLTASRPRSQATNLDVKEYLKALPPLKNFKKKLPTSGALVSHKHSKSYAGTSRVETDIFSTDAGGKVHERAQIYELTDFHLLSVLGKGNFGKVLLAEDRKRGMLVALKVLKKSFIIENDEMDRQVLADARISDSFSLSFAC